MKVYKLRRLPIKDYGSRWCIFTDNSLDGITSELENSEIGDKYQVELIDMDKQEVDNLPEFDGW